MTSCGLSLRCRAVSSAALALAFALGAAGCGADDEPVCTGGRTLRAGKCVCPDEQIFEGGACIADRLLVPRLASNIVDRGGNTGVGIGLALDGENYPHLAYYEYNGGDLRYATASRSSGKWAVENVDVEGVVGVNPALALYDPAGAARPVVVYYDESHKALKGAFKSKAGWVRKFLDPRGTDPGLDRGKHASVAVHETGGKHTAHVAYLDTLSQDLYYLSWNLDKPDDYSAARLVDSGFTVINEQPYGSGVIADVTSIAVDSQGQPVIAYRDAKNGDLKVANFVAADDAWQATFVDNDPYSQLNYEDLGEFASLAIDKIDNYHVAYFDRTSLALKYAEFDGSDWYVETVERGDVGYYASIAVRPDRSPVIAYFDKPLGAAKVAHKRRDGTWQVEIVANYGVAGQFVRLALTDRGWPAVAYREFFSEALYFDYVLTVFP